MPIHDWTRVAAGDFHDFHQVWTGQMRIHLNGGILPLGYYAQIEQQASGVTPDVLTLHYSDARDESDLPPPVGAVAVAEAPPKVAFRVELEQRLYAEQRNRVVIRHRSHNRIVSLIEIVSSGNKSGEREFERFLDKAYGAIEQGIHLLIVDLYPPTPRDPHGIHGSLWAELGEDGYVAPKGKPLTVASYVAAALRRAYVEPVAVGDALPSMPLFLTSTHYVAVPLEETYMTCFATCAPHVHEALELRR
jgi:Protein of unknown function (DUF4058)